MKLLKVAVAVLVMAAMAVPVIAEDRLSLSGQMRTRMFHTDFDKADNTQTWANQRLRLGGKIAVAEGVSVTFRTDITEGTNWGDSSSFGSGADNPERSNGFGHARSGSQQQWDRAHLDLTKGMFHLRAGQQYVGTGGTFAIDTQDSGLALMVKTGAPIKAFFIVDKDNASVNVSDAYLYGASINPKGDNFSAKFIAAGYSDSNAGADIFMAGVSGSTNLGPVKLFGEFDYFGGDASDTVDAFGTQLFLDASLAASDAVTLGGQVFYALGDDEDMQITRLGNGFNGWDPIFDVGTSLSNEQITFGNAFNIAANNSSKSALPGFTIASAGMVGGRLYTSWKASDALTFGASAAYLTEEDDSVVEVSEMALAAGMVYKIMENTSIQWQLQYTDGDVTLYDAAGAKLVDDESFNSFRAGSGIFVNF